MPSTGTPASKTPGSQRGADASETLRGPPDSTMPAGRRSRISPIGVLNGRISEYTDNSRRRRAMSCVNCDPKSRTTMVW